MADAKIVLNVADLLSLPDDAIVAEALAMLAQVLQGGNASAQKTFIEHFLGAGVIERTSC